MSIARAFAADVPNPATKLVLLAMTALATKKADRLLFSAAHSRAADLAQVDSEQFQAAQVDLVRRGLIEDTGERVGRTQLRVWELHLPEVQ